MKGNAAVKMPTVATLEEVTKLAQGHSHLFVRWSRGPDADAAGPSCDDLTGVALPGLSANPLAVEPWWGDRPLRLWIARRLYDTATSSTRKDQVYGRGSSKAAYRDEAQTTNRLSDATAPLPGSPNR